MHALIDWSLPTIVIDHGAGESFAAATPTFSAMNTR